MISCTSSPLAAHIPAKPGAVVCSAEITEVLPAGAPEQLKRASQAQFRESASRSEAMTANPCLSRFWRSSLAGRGIRSSHPIFRRFMSWLLCLPLACLATATMRLTSLVPDEAGACSSVGVLISIGLHTELAGI